MVNSSDKTAGAAECRDIERVFHACFLHPYRVRLSGGHSEPLYLPAEEPGSYAELRYREDHVSSALHEIAHWCIAGTARRQQVDFGYWYEPDGRSTALQQAFERVEVKPQALEWIFSHAVGIRFHISVDNLSNQAQHRSRLFGQAVYAQVRTYLDAGLPPRACGFAEALTEVYASSQTFDVASYVLSDI